MSAVRFASDSAAIANAYSDLLKLREVVPDVSPEIVAAWRELAEDSLERAHGVRLLVNVRITDDPEPYESAGDMCADIAHGNFVVSRAHSDHPVWDRGENVAFRIVHDVLGHFAATVGSLQADIPGPPIVGDWDRDAAEHVAGFDWEGECRACAAHAPLLPSIEARKALFTECLAQTAYAIERGGFGPQVAGFTGAYLYTETIANSYDKFITGR